MRLLRLALSMLAVSSAVTISRAQAPALSLWNQLGSQQEVETSRIGPPGVYTAGAFVPGRFGTGVELTMQQQAGVSFPLDVLTKTNGCVEFWAKLVGFPTTIPAGPNPALIKTEPWAIEVCFAPNDGNANGGLCINSVLGWVGTSSFGSWSYARALDTSSAADWHHYALVWKGNGRIPGVADTGRQVAMYVDGKLNTTTGINNPHTNVIHKLAPGGRLCLIGRSTSAASSYKVIFDNLKVWNFTKTDFSDRFVEGSSLPCSLTIAGSPSAVGAASPDNYGTCSKPEQTVVTNSVPEMVPAGERTRYVAAGWTGAGSVPPAGAGRRVIFTITNDSSVTWQWLAQHRVVAEAGSGGTVSGGGWFEEGGEAGLEATPDAGFVFVQWSDGSTERSRRVIVPAGGAAYAAEFSEAAELHVLSTEGEPAPACGIHALAVGSTVEASVAPVVATEATRQVCAGWRGTGSVPAAGTSNSVQFVLERTSSLAWYWSSEAFLNLRAEVGGTVLGSGWYAAGALVRIIAIPAEGYRFAGWSDGIIEPARWVVVPARGASFAAQFRELPLDLVRFQQDAIRVDEAAGVAVLTVERIGLARSAAAVICKPRPGTARAGSDFLPAAIKAVWPAGDKTARLIRIPLVVDRVAEGDESFTVELMNPAQLVRGDPSVATVTIAGQIPPPAAPAGLSTIVLEGSAFGK